SRLLPQRTSEACGSRSSAITLSPAAAAATASDAASVVFPAPPFCVSNATVRISIHVTSGTLSRCHKTPIAESCGAQNAGGKADAVPTCVLFADANGALPLAASRELPHHGAGTIAACCKSAGETSGGPHCTVR